MNFFEGPEKKIGLALVGHGRSLRDYPDDFWGEIVKCARAEVLSVMRAAGTNAMLLSESALIVRDDSLTMITCGQTELVRAAERLLEVFPREHLGYLFYARKNEHRPDLQRTGFRDDAATLHAIVPGQVVRFGRRTATTSIFFTSPEPSRRVPTRAPSRS